LVPKSWKMAIIILRRRGGTCEECTWQLIALSKSVNERRASSSYNYDSCCVISPAVARCLQFFVHTQYFKMTGFVPESPIFLFSSSLQFCRLLYLRETPSLLELLKLASGHRCVQFEMAKHVLSSDDTAMGQDETFVELEPHDYPLLCRPPAPRIQLPWSCPEQLQSIYFIHVILASSMEPHAHPSPDIPIS